MNPDDTDYTQPLPAYALPSVQTEGEYFEGLAQDDLNILRNHFAHAWAHYHALELVAISSGDLTQGVLKTLDEELGVQVTDENEIKSAYLIVSLAVRYLVGTAYNIAHSGLEAAETLLDAPDAIRAMFAGYDYDNPQNDEPIWDLDELQ